MPDFDVIVVGGGPAGSTAAYEAAKAGLKTILLEKDRYIGTPVRCGEAIGEEGLKQFIEPDPKWVAATIERVRIHSPQNTALDFKIPGGKGLILHRHLFDDVLAQRAAVAGADIQTSAYVDGLCFSDGQVNGVEYEHLGQRRSLSAKIIIAADGIESRIGRMAGLRTALKLGDTESGYQVTAKNVAVDQGLIDFYVGQSWSPGGYLWVFPKGEGMANIGLAVGGKYTKQFTAKLLLERFLENHFPEAVVASGVAGGIPVAKTLKKITAGGIILAGDAARMVNPLSGGGITSGMVGGKLAGIVASNAIDSGDYSAKGLVAFEALWHKAVGKDHARFYRISKTVQELSDDHFEKMARELKAIPAEKLNILKVFMSIVKHKPKILLDVSRAFAGL